MVEGQTCLVRLDVVKAPSAQVDTQGSNSPAATQKPEKLRAVS